MTDRLLIAMDAAARAGAVLAGLDDPGTSLGRIIAADTERMVKAARSSCCMRCGRQLTDPVSIRCGIGPDCWQLEPSSIFRADRL